MKIYTKTGDTGQTTLFGGDKICKNDLRVDCYGTIDELNSFLGIAISFIDEKNPCLDELELTQANLLRFGSDLATPLCKTWLKTSRINEKDVQMLEKWIDKMDEKLPLLTKFILPGGKKEQAFIHLARTVCRRAERKLVTLMQKEDINPICLKYLNRLSDYLFTLARFLGTK